MFDAIREMAKNAKQLTSNMLLEQVYENYDEDFQDVVVKLNTEEQLFEGVNSLNVELTSIGLEYAESTVNIKEKKGQPTNRVTLKDTGDFYDSFEVSISQGDLIIEADTVKGKYDLQDRWGDDLIGLSEQSIEKLQFFIKPLLQEAIIDKLFE